MYQVVCEAQPTIDATGSAQCSTGWVVEQSASSLIPNIVDLLTFDLSTFAYLFGVAVLLFVTGFGIGITNRTINRV